MIEKNIIILSNQTESNVLQLTSSGVSGNMIYYVPVAVINRNQLTGDTISFEASYNGSEFYNIRTANGDLVKIVGTNTSKSFYTLTSSHFDGIKYLKLISSSDEAEDRNLKIILKSISEVSPGGAVSSTVLPDITNLQIDVDPLQSDAVTTQDIGSDSFLTSVVEVGSNSTIYQENISKSPLYSSINNIISADGIDDSLSGNINQFNTDDLALFVTANNPKLTGIDIVASFYSDNPDDAFKSLVVGFVDSKATVWYGDGIDYEMLQEDTARDYSNDHIVSFIKDNTSGTLYIDGVEIVTSNETYSSSVDNLQLFDRGTQAYGASDLKTFVGYSEAKTISQQDTIGTHLKDRYNLNLPIPSITIDIVQGTGVDSTQVKVTPNLAYGTIYYVVTQNASAPTSQQIKNGSVGDYSGSVMISDISQQEIDISGLIEGNTYYMHLLHTVPYGVESAVVTTNSFEATPVPENSKKVVLTASSSLSPNGNKVQPFNLELIRSKLTTSEADEFWSNVKADGGDIRIFYIGGSVKQQVPFELTYFDKTDEKGVLWINTEDHQASVNTQWQIEFGNQNLSMYSENDAFGSGNVWDDNFLLVTHDAGFTDSTLNNNDSISYDIGSASIGGSTGILGASTYFDVDSNPHFIIPSIELVSNWCVSALINLEDAQELSSSIAGSDEMSLKVDQFSDTGKVGVTKSGEADYASTLDTPYTEGWVILSFVKENSVINIYKNGVLEDIISEDIDLNIDMIGSDQIEKSFEGYLNEFLVSKINKTADYLKEQSNSFLDQSSFWSLSNIEDI